MILDWSTQCYKIHKTRNLSRDDPSDNKSIFSQEAHYIKFLSLKGLSYRDIYFQWAKIKNGMAAVFKDEPEQMVATFARVYKSSLNVSEKVFKQHYTPVKLYKSEIKFLNSIEAPIWVRQYWLVMLIYWKFASQHTKNVEINGTLCNWALRQTDICNKRFGRHQDEIAQYNRTEDGYILSTGIAKKKNGRIYWFDWLKENNNGEIVEVKNLDNLKKALKLIVENKQTCPVCGKQFAFGGKCKRLMCGIAGNLFYAGKVKKMANFDCALRCNSFNFSFCLFGFCNDFCFSRYRLCSCFCWLAA